MAKLGDYVQFDQPRPSAKLGEYLSPAPASISQPRTGDVEHLLGIARDEGYGKEAQQIVEKKPFNLFGTLMSLLSRGQYASAGAANEAVKQVRGQAPTSATAIARAVGRGIAGTPTSYADVLETAGVQNKAARAIGGFAGDVALDPLTYISPAGAAKAVGVTVGKKAPVIAKAAKTATQAAARAAKPLADAFGDLFVHGYGVTPTVVEKTLQAGKQLERAKQGIVESNLKRLNFKPDEEAKIFNALVQTRLAEYRARTGEATAVKNFAVEALNKMREAGVADDSIKTMSKQLERARTFAKGAGLDNPYEAYFPFLKQENLKQVEQAVSGLKVGSMGYVKRFQAKLKPEEIINSIPEAYARREFQMVRDKITRDVLNDAVRRVGKEFATEVQAKAAGFVPLRTKGQFGEVLGYVPQKDRDFLQKTLEPEYTAIDKIARLSGYDAFTNLWKTAITKYFPAFHVRNFQSGVQQNYQMVGADALNPKLFLAARDTARYLAGKTPSKQIELGNKTFKLGQIAKAFEDRFGRGDWRHIADIGETIFREKNLSLPSRTLRGLQSNPITKAADSVGEFVESNQKMVAYLASLKQGKSIPEALRVAEQAGFDYSRITPFEQRILKRIIPFYTFTRKNLELQGKTLVQNPARTGIIGKAGEAASVASGSEATPEERAGLPDFIQQGQNVRTNQTDEFGRPLYLGSFGTALEAATQLLSGNPVYKAISQSNPILKYIFEKSTGINTFRSAAGQQVDVTDVRKADKYADAPKPIRDFLKLKKTTRVEYVNGKPLGKREGWDADPDRLHILESLPTSRLIPALIEAFNLGRRKKSSEGKTDFQTVINLLTGTKLYAVDPAEQAYFKEKAQARDLTRFLEKAGVIKTFSTPYVPKEQ